MRNEEIIAKFLQENQNRYCDDCLHSILKISPRQQVNQICRKLENKDIILREKNRCFNCRQYKITNSSVSSFTQRKEITQPKRNSLTPRIKSEEYEKQLGDYLRKKNNLTFSKESLLVGPDKYHEFDLVSNDKSIIIECKSLTWTKGNHYPSAKITSLITSLFYFSRIHAKKKILTIEDDYSNTGASLADRFVRLNEELLDDVEVWATRFSSDNNVRVVRTSKGCIWYQEMFGAKKSKENKGMNSGC